MRRQLVIVMMAAGVLVWHGRDAAGSFILEQEVAGQAANNTVATAQWVTGGAFDPRFGNPFGIGPKPTATIRGNVFGEDVDFYRINATFAGDAWFFVRNLKSLNAHILSLFDSTGTLIAVAGSHGANPTPQAGTTLLGTVPLPSSGVYYVAVSERAPIGGGLAQNNWPVALNAGTVGETLTRPDNLPQTQNWMVENAEVGNANFLHNGPQPADLPAPFTNNVYELLISGPFANAGPSIAPPGANQWASGLGGASVPGGVDMRFQTNIAFPSAAFQVSRLHSTSQLPDFDGFIQAGSVLQAWEIEEWSFDRHQLYEMWFGYDPEPILAAGIDPQDLRIYHHHNGQWEEGGLVDVPNNQIYFATTSLSPFVLGVVPEPTSFALLGLGGLMMVRRSRQCG